MSTSDPGIERASSATEMARLLALLGAALRAIPGVDEAWIFGSTAARFRGESGPPPQDVDVLVVGAPDGFAVLDACIVVARELNSEINPVIVTASEWASGAGSFLADVRARPRERIPLGLA